MCGNRVMRGNFPSRSRETEHETLTTQGSSCLITKLVAKRNSVNSYRYLFSFFLI